MCKKRQDETNIKFAFVDFERNNVKIINGNDIKNVKKSVVTFYTENGRTRSVNISGAKILKNNAAFTNYRNETEYFKRPNGYLELTDNNRDGKYDVVNIMEPTIIEVENVSVGDGLKVVDKSGNDYDFSKCDHISITMDGRSSTEKGMTSANFLLMYISPENINVSIDGISSTISGKITGVGEDSVSIDGKEYTLADYFKNDSGFVKRLIVGCEETFYYSGNVIYALSEKTFQSENINIGFVLRAGYDQYKQQVELRVYTSDGIFRDLYLNRSVMIDGTKWSLDEILQDYYKVSDSTDLMDYLEQISNIGDDRQQNPYTIFNFYNGWSNNPLTNTAGGTVMLGYAADCDDSFALITTQNLKYEKYKPDCLPDIMEEKFLGTNKYDGIYFQRYYPLYTQYSKIWVVDYERSEVSIREGTPQDIQPYDTYGSECSKILVSRGRHLFILNDHRAN